MIDTGIHPLYQHQTAAASRVIYCIYTQVPPLYMLLASLLYFPSRCKSLPSFWGAWSWPGLLWCVQYTELELARPWS